MRQLAEKTSGGCGSEAVGAGLSVGLDDGECLGGATQNEDPPEPSMPHPAPVAEHPHLHETQSFLAAHVDKVRALELSMKLSNAKLACCPMVFHPRGVDL